jgi:hypothetical protein
MTVLTSDQKIGTATLLSERGRVPVNGSELVSVYRTTLINRLSNDVDDSAESLGTNGHENGLFDINDVLSTDETFSGVHSNSTHVVTTEMLGNLEDKTMAGALDLKSVENWRKFSLELDVDDGSNNLGNLSNVFSSSRRETTCNRRTNSQKASLRVLRHLRLAMNLESISKDGFYIILNYGLFII